MLNHRDSAATAAPGTMAALAGAPAGADAGAAHANGAPSPTDRRDLERLMRTLELVMTGSSDAGKQATCRELLEKLSPYRGL
jgi:hypothetical protein